MIEYAFPAEKSSRVPGLRARRSVERPALRIVASGDDGRTRRFQRDIEALCQRGPEAVAAAFSALILPEDADCAHAVLHSAAERVRHGETL